MLNRHIFILCLLAGIALTACNSNSTPGANKTSTTAVNEIDSFIKCFIPVTSPFNTNGGDYSSQGVTQYFKDTRVINKHNFGFLQRSNMAIPDTFYAAGYFDLGNYYLCLIRNFADTGGSFAGANSSLLLVNKNGLTDVLPMVTFQLSDDVYKHCWVKNLDNDTLPEIVTRKAYGEEDGGMDNPAIYKITNGRFKPTTDIKIDTTEFSF